MYPNPKTTKIVSQSGVPIGIPSSGTIGNNGALSAITALPTTFSGGIYLYFPANSIAAGVAAGIYYCVMSSTTAGTIYNNTYTSGESKVPAALTAFATTGPGAYTQSTSEITLKNCIVPGGMLGVNGSLIRRVKWAYTNSAGTKTLRDKYGASTLAGPSRTTTTADYWMYTVDNQGVSNVQIGPAQPQAYLSSASNFVYYAVDSTVDQTYAATGQLGAAADWIICASATLEVTTL